jgi:ABC-2 type transport system permease protein
MNRFVAALGGELHKILRASILPASMGFFAFGGLMIASMMYLAGHPELVAQAPLVATKARTLGNGTWPDLLGFLVQMGLILSQLGFGFVTAWVFGRETTDRTLKDLLALPVGRSSLVTAKFVASAFWSLALAAAAWLTGVGAGWAWGLPGFDGAVLVQEGLRYWWAAVLSLPLITVAGLLASVTRGYLLPVAALLLFLILTNMVAVVAPSALPWFPWGIPAVLVGVGGDIPAGWGSGVILGATGAIAFMATVGWWRWADQV